MKVHDTLNKNVIYFCTIVPRTDNFYHNRKKYYASDYHAIQSCELPLGRS